MNPETTPTSKPLKADIFRKQPSIFSELPEHAQGMTDLKDSPEETPASFQFVETCPSTVTRSQRLQGFNESGSSINGIHSDCQPLRLKNQRSNESNNTHHILHENEEGPTSYRSTSVNLIGDTVYNGASDYPTKLLDEDGFSRKTSIPMNHVTFSSITDEEKDNESGNSGHHRLLLHDTPSSEDGLDKKRQYVPAKKSWFTSYKERKEEKRRSLAMSPKNKEYSSQIDEDEKNNGEFQLNIHQAVEQEGAQSPPRRTTRVSTIIPGNMSALQEDVSPQSRYHSPTSPFNLQFSNRVEDHNRLNLNIQPASSWQATSPEEEHAILETKLYLKRACSLFIAIGLFSLIAMLVIKDILALNHLFLAVLFYFNYYAIENIVRACSYQRQVWREVEDNHNILDAISGGIFVIVVMLKLSKTVSVSMISFIPFLSTTGVYNMFSKAPKPTKRLKILTRCFYTLQSFLITAKLDKIIEIDWKIILGLGCVYIGIITLTHAISAVNEVRSFVRNIINRRTQRDIKLSIEFVGTLWRLLCCALSILAFLACISLLKTDLNQEESFDSVKRLAVIGLGISIFAALYTTIAFKPLTQFSKRYHRLDIPLVFVDSSREQTKQPSKIDLKIEKQKSYFVMLSSTYFLPLKNSFTMRKEENIKRIKKMIQDINDWRSPSHRQNNAQPKPANIEELKNDKDALDGMFGKLTTQKAISPRPTTRTPRVKISTMVNTNNKHHHAENSHNNMEQGIITTIGTLESHRKQNLSADDFHFNNMLMKSVRTVGEENLCYLCFDNPPNAVLMQCGHGGICYECANALVKKKNECMECRCTVEAIYKVDVNKNLNDIVRCEEFTKVCVNS